MLHIQHYLSANCFGDYVTRSGLNMKTREMVPLSFLIALGGIESQLKGHIRGNANIGNDRQTLINLMTQLLPYVGYPPTLNAISCLNEIITGYNCIDIFKNENIAKDIENYPSYLKRMFLDK